MVVHRHARDIGVLVEVEADDRPFFFLWSSFVFVGHSLFGTGFSKLHVAAAAAGAATTAQLRAQPPNQTPPPSAPRSLRGLPSGHGASEWTTGTAGECRPIGGPIRPIRPIITHHPSRIGRSSRPLMMRRPAKGGEALPIR